MGSCVPRELCILRFHGHRISGGVCESWSSLWHSQIWCWHHVDGGDGLAFGDEVYHSSCYGRCVGNLWIDHGCHHQWSHYCRSRFVPCIPRVAHLAAGLTVGLSSLAAGMAIGIVGDAGVRANAQQPKLFIGMILILIFAEALGLYGLIVGLVVASGSGVKGLCTSYKTA